MIKLTRSEMQTVVDFLQIQHDSLFEIIADKTTLEEDRKKAKKDEKAVRKFILAARERGLDMSNSFYPLEKKVKLIEEE